MVRASPQKEKVYELQHWILQSDRHRLHGQDRNARTHDTGGVQTEVPRETALAIIDMSERYSMKHFHSRKNFPVPFRQILSEIYLMGFLHAFEAMDAAESRDPKGARVISEKSILAVGGVLLAACSSEKGMLKPWKPFDIAPSRGNAPKPI